MNKIRYFASLKGKIQVIFSILFLLSGILFGAIIFVSIKPDLINEYRRELSSNVELIASMTQIYINSTIKNHLETIANKTREYAEYEYQRFKKNEIKESAAYDNLKKLILDPQYGKIGETGYLAGVSSKGILAIHPKAEGTDASKFEFMKKATTMKNGYIEYQWKNPGDKSPREKAGGMSYFEPWDLIIWASSYKSEFLSMIDHKKLETIVNSISIGKNGYAYIIDTKGNVIFHKTIEGENLWDKKDNNNKFYFQDLIKIAKENQDKSNIIFYPGEIDSNSGSGSHMAVFKYIPDIDWIVIASTPSSDIIFLLRKVILIIAIILVLSFILINIIVNVIFSRVLKPVKNIHEISSSVTSGDLTRRVEVESKDEIGLISTQFNDMISKFESMLNSIQNSSKILLDSVQELSISSQEIASTSNQQAAALKEIVTTMEDSDQLSRSIANKIEEVTRVSNATKAGVNSGFDIIKDSLNKMNEIKDANAGTITGIKSLSERIENIWEIVNIINGIADQTKIIAFNAELEASAAGDAGKNFQIVATEIRRLADNTVSSTNEIRTKINEIQHSSDKLIITSEDGTSKIRDGWVLSNNLQKVFEDILSSSEISYLSASQIALSIKQQVSAFEQILLTLKQVSEGIDNFVLSTKSTSNASDNLRKLASSLNSIVEGYKVRSGNNG